MAKEERREERKERPKKLSQAVLLAPVLNISVSFQQLSSVLAFWLCFRTLIHINKLGI